MQTSSQAALPAPVSINGPSPHTPEPIEFTELALTVDLLLESHPVFSDAVKAALLPLGGEFLFDLPHAEKPGGKGRVAAVRIRYAGAQDARLAFVFLSDDAMDARVSPPDRELDHLKSFAESFVGVLEKIAD
ncbi:hypothetical protein M2360_003885 [Rhizobium sp. SG_E_25_P2]|uniref:hypothetical protein n=1 Tax=Rhizobium sp. SG_E_25_P2 TaxID=2879942 RepID=UPI002476C49D|nr:hypothetical protein [Rhizobium sp. SG_E_25_P2]MDH6268479.1 hypothetical protein [Rhizobium sp. SG_E_25_P2]